MKTNEVIAHFGSVNAVAKELCMYHSAVSQWGVFPPYLRQCEIELVTSGKLKREPNTKQINKKSSSINHHHPETKVS
jgi:hypothetical protein